MKKLMISSIILLPIVVLMILLISSSVVAVKSHIYVEAIESTEETIYLKMEDENNKPEKKMDIQIRPFSATNKGLRYTSSDENIVTVDENGVIKAVNFGRAYVTATSKEDPSLAATISVVVYDTKVHSVNLECQRLTLYEGEDIRTKVTVIPEQAENKNLTYRSSDTVVADVAQDGHIYAKSFGTTIITVESDENPAIKSQIEIRVLSTVKGLTIPEEERGTLTLAERTAKFPNVSFVPETANEEVTYSSSSEEIASVDENGNITFHKAGRVRITATTVDGMGNTASVYRDYICTDGHYTTLAFAESETEFDFDEYYNKKPLPLELVGSPAGASVGLNAPTFSIDGVIEYRDGKFYVVNPSASEVTITVTAQPWDWNGRDNTLLKATKTIKIYRDATEIQLTKESLYFSGTNYDIKQNFKTIPENATSNVQYQCVQGSANIVGGLATLSGEGLFVFKVTLTNHDGETIEKTFIVSHTTAKVGEVHTELSAGDDSRLEIHHEGQDLLYSIWFTAQSGYQNVSFESTNEQIVSVSGHGHLTIKKGGEAQIKITNSGEDAEEVVTTLTVVVDRDVDQLEIVDINGEDLTSVSTSKDQIEFKVKVTPADAMANKTLTLADNVQITNTTEEGNAKVYTLKATFDTAFDGDINVKVQAAKTVSDKFNVHATNGKLDSLQLTVDEEAIDLSKVYEIIDDEELRIGISNDFTPADFTISSDGAISVAENRYVTSRVEQEQGKYFVVLSAKDVISTSTECYITLGGVTVGVKVRVLRNVSEITVKQTDSTYNQEYDLYADGSLVITPSKHTDRIEFKASDSIATVSDRGVVTFSATGSVIITITAYDQNNEQKASAQITLRHEQQPEGDPINLTQDNQGEEQYLYLELGRGQDAAGRRSIHIDPIEGYTSQEIKAEGDVVRIDDQKIVAIKGGFATVTVKMSNGSGQDDLIWTIKVYVDEAITIKQFSLASGTRTAHESLDFELTLGTKDQLVGKEVRDTNDKVSKNGNRTEQNNLVYSYTANFTSAESITFDVSFYYTQEAKAYLDAAKKERASDVGVSITLISTFGEIDELNVFNGEQKLAQGQTLSLMLGEQLKFRVDHNVQPADFDFRAESIAVSSVLPYSVAENGGEFEITITPSVVNKNGDSLTITVGKKSLTVNIKTYKDATAVQLHTANSVLTNSNVYDILAALVDSDSTNTLKYEVIKNTEVASVNSEGHVTFSREGAVVVKISALSHENVETAWTTITISYVTKDRTEKVVEISDSTSNEVLDLDWDESPEKSVLYITFKAGYVDNITIVAQDDQIVRVDGYRIIALKGGQTTVTITAHNDGEVWTKEVTVNVNRHAASITFATLDDQELVSGFETSKKAIEFYVKVAPADAMALADKKLVADNVTFNFVKNEGGAAYYRAQTTLNSRVNNLTIKLMKGEVDEMTTALLVNSTLGDINTFTLSHNGVAVGPDNDSFVIENIGQDYKQEFYIESSSISPADFELSADAANIGYNGYSNVKNLEMSVQDSRLMIAFYGENPGRAQITISIGTKQVNFTLDVKAPAENIEVKYNGQKLESGVDYGTFLDVLNLDFTLTRADGIVPTTTNISFTKDGAGNEMFAVGSFTAGVGEYVFSADNVTFTFKLSKATSLGNVTITISYPISGGSLVAVDKTEFISATDQDLGLSWEMLGTLTLEVGYGSSTLLGTVTSENIQTLFKVTAPEGWEVAYLNGGNITIKINSATIEAQKLELEYLDKKVTYTLTKINIGNVNFVGFDMDKQVSGNDDSGVKAVNTDVYGNGYQQVKVFAKHSYYYVNGQWRKVDFFRLPIEVLSVSLAKADKSYLDFITWEMTAFLGKAADTSIGTNGLMTRQLGRNIRYMSQTYTLNEDGSVTDASGKQIVDANGCFVGTDKITFVDPFSDYNPEGTSYVRIYFGSFQGLTEEYIQNNRFGAFYTLGEPTGEQTFDELGRYMRVSAIYGSEKSRSYNFNVVEDGYTDEKGQIQNVEIVNVSDAQAFYSNKYVVLQTNLTEAMLTTNDSNLLDKELIYGNGYEINLQYKSRNGGGTFKYGKAYNVYIKGGDPDYQSGTDDRVLEMNGTYAQYCDISVVNKGTIWRKGDDVHILNTVFKYCKECAIQIYKSDTTLPNTIYVEDIIIVDSLAALEVVAEGETCETNGFYIKGFLDVFNYRNKADMEPFMDDIKPAVQKYLGESVTDWAIDKAIDDMIKDAASSGIVETYTTKDNSKVNYFNLVMFYSKDGYSRHFHYWDPTSKSYQLTTFTTTGWVIKTEHCQTEYNDGRNTYNINRIDNSILKLGGIGIYGFGTNRTDINVNCQLREGANGTELNSEHLKWHMSRVKRDHDLIGYDYSGHQAQ